MPPEDVPSQAPRRDPSAVQRAFNVGAIAGLVLIIYADPEHNWFALFVGPAYLTTLHPGFAFIPAAVFAIASVGSAMRLGRFSWQSVVLAGAALAWFMNHQLEVSAQASGANIRIDLLLVGPFVWVATVAGVVAAVKSVTPVKTAPTTLTAVLAIALALTVFDTAKPKPPEFYGPSLSYSNSRAFAIAEMSFDVDRGYYRGPCPVTLTFSGAIRTRGASGFLDYAFRRSDGTADSGHTLHFTAGESKAVSTTWTVGKGGERLEGWQQVAIDKPYDGMLRAPFVVECQGVSTSAVSAAAAPPAARRGPFHIVRVSLEADRDTFAGRCPVPVTLTGTVTTAGGAGDVSYRLYRPNEEPDLKWQELRFDSAGSKVVRAVWRAGGDSGRASEGWSMFAVDEGALNPPNPDAPTIRVSRHFAATCDSTPSQRAAAKAAAVPPAATKTAAAPPADPFPSAPRFTPTPKVPLSPAETLAVRAAVRPLLERGEAPVLWRSEKWTEVSGPHADAYFELPFADVNERFRFRKKFNCGIRPGRTAWSCQAFGEGQLKSNGSVFTAWTSSRAEVVQVVEFLFSQCYATQAPMVRQYRNTTAFPNTIESIQPDEGTKLFVRLQQGPLARAFVMERTGAKAPACAYTLREAR